MRISRCGLPPNKGSEAYDRIFFNYNHLHTFFCIDSRNCHRNYLNYCTYSSFV